MAFHCTLVTPEHQGFDARILQAILPAHDGLLGILSGRAPILVRLGTGPLRLDLTDGSRRHYFIDGGFAQMKNNELTILTTEAIPAEQIDYEAARAEFEQASALRAADEASAQKREHELERARVKQHLATRR